MEGHGAVHAPELDGLRLFAFLYAHGHLAHGRHLDADGVAVERQVFQLLLGQFVFHALEVLQVAQHVEHVLLRSANLAYATFKFTFHYIEYVSPPDPSPKREEGSDIINVQSSMFNVQPHSEGFLRQSHSVARSLSDT